MAPSGKGEKKSMAEVLGGAFKQFGSTVSEILEDPELSEKAKEFAEIAVQAAARVAEKKVKDEDMRSKLRSVGKAAKVLGKNLEEHFDRQNPAE